MAPESLQAKQYSVKSDVWSWAVVVYEVFSKGGEPYGNVLPIVAATNVLQGKTLEEDLPSKVPEELKRLLVRCWSKSADSRPTFDEIYQHLKMMNPRVDVYL